jgi:hypothetical protein
MRRKLLCTATAAATLLAAVIVWRLTATEPGQGPPPEASPGKAAPPALPLTQVVLFNSVVGYFQREGQVEGSARVELTFPAADVNDLLKSLVLQDQGGGKFSGVNYDNHEPVDRILRSFALDLNNNPTYGQILNQARGEKVEVLRQRKGDAQAVKLTGTIVGMQSQRREGQGDLEHLNLLAAGGLQSILLDEVQAVRFLNPVLESEFQRALRVVAAGHDTQKKTVSLGFTGQGKRQVRVGYVVERPIWKTSYRLLFEPGGKLFLQGWALVENTGDDDWNNVRLVLVSGRPISFQMNLYDPLYVPRPTVEPELFASLRPPVYGGALGAPPAPPEEGGPARMPPGFGMGGMGMGGFPMGGMGMGGFPGGGLPGGPPMPPSIGGLLPGLQFGSLTPPNIAQSSNIYQNPQGQTLPVQRLTYEELQRRREEARQEKEKAKKVGPLVTGLNFKEGIASVATGEAAGDSFRYVIDQKVSLPRQKSAMLPILNRHVEGSKVSIYNASVHPKYPLLGLRLKNTSGQPLTQGPITVYEDGAYAGDSRVLDLQPNEERLLSYALDLAAEVKADSKTTPSPHMTLKLGDAKLAAAYKAQQTTTYLIKNRSAQVRTLLLEHPIRADWDLVAPTRPTERTRAVYRFRVAVPAGQAARFDVVEEQGRVDQFALLTGARPHYAVATGIEVRAAVKASPQELLGVKIRKGFLQARYRLRETRTYYVQNNSDRDRTFRVDHVVRAGWTRLDPKDKEQLGPAVFPFTLEVPAGKAAQRAVIEERVLDDRNHKLNLLTKDALRSLLDSPVPGPMVKEVLRKVLELNGKYAETERRLGEQQTQLKTVSEDQARVRENLKIIPASAEPYKGFVQKFVAQETEIENLQRDIRLLQADLRKQEAALEAYVSSQSAE